MQESELVWVWGILGLGFLEPVYGLGSGHMQESELGLGDFGV